MPRRPVPGRVVVSLDDFDSTLAAAQAGEEWAVAVLYRDLNPRLLRYLRTQAPEVAEDLASEVWMGAARQLPGFTGDESAFRGWLFTIARRRVIQHWRQTGRRRTRPVPVEDLLERPSDEDGEAVALRGLNAQAAIDLLAAHLPPDQLEVVLLRVVAELDVEQVAALVGKSRGAVRVMQHRALKRLAERLPREAVTG